MVFTHITTLLFLSIMFTHSSYSNNFHETVIEQALITEKSTSCTTQETTTQFKLENFDKKVDPYQAKKIYTSLFSKNFETELQETLFNAETLKKLSIIAHQDNTKGSLAYILPTSTVGGTLLTKCAIATPAITLEDALKNQNITHFFVEHPEATHQLSTAFQTIAKTEMYALSWYDIQHPTEKQIIDAFYSSWLPKKNALILALMQNTTRFLRFLPVPLNNIQQMYVNLIIADGMAAGYHKIAAFLKENGSPGVKTIIKGVEETTNSLKEFNNIINAGSQDTGIAKYLKLSLNIALIDPIKNFIAFHDFRPNSPNPHGIMNIHQTLLHQKYSPKLAYLIFLVPLMQDVSLYLRYKQSLQEHKLEEMILSHLHNRLAALADIMTTCKEIVALCTEHPELAQNFCHYKAIAHLFDASQTDDIKNLIHLFTETNTFKKPYSFFSNCGNILAAYTLVQEHKNELIDALYACYKLDGYLAAAHLVTDSNPDKGLYSFVTFINNDTPLLHAHSIRNPLIPSAQNYTPHSFSLDGTATLGDHNMLITGPNGSGKSVFMSSIPLSIILAQTYGITCAKSLVTTVFEKIITSVNVQEDLQENRSTFMAQQKSFTQALKEARQANTMCKKSLALLDEALSGTSDCIGGIVVFEGGKELAFLPYVTTLLASHFTEPATLEKATAGEFATYYLDVIVENNTIKRLFTLIRGVNPWWKIDQEKTTAYVHALSLES